MSERFYFDTYALVEIFKGNPNYEKYKKDIYLIINKLNLLEYAYFLIRNNKQNEIKEFFERFSGFNVDYDEEDLIKAALMKYQFKNQKLSFIDCIGYILAKKHKVKFLTGDEKFIGKENVEFVK